MHILFISDNFFPENNAPAIRTHEHCKIWAAKGHAVTVITTVPNFPIGKVQVGYHNRWRQEEYIDGIRVIRVWSYIAPNHGIVLRSLDFLSFAVTAFTAGLREKPDVIVATSPQLLAGLAGQGLAKAKSLPWLLEIRDLWPESIVAVGVVKKGPLIAILKKLEHSLYRNANKIVTASEALRHAIIAKGVAPAKISVIPNGTNLQRLSPRAPDIALSERLKIDGCFCLGYVGTLGMAHSLHFVLRAADFVKNEKVKFVFVGDGAKRRELEALAVKLELANVHFEGMVPSYAVPSYLSICDAVIVSLKKVPLFDSAMPSKLFEAGAMKRPVILCGRGIAADLIEKYHAGVVVEPENPSALAEAIVKLASDAHQRRLMGEGGEALSRDHDREKLAERMLAEIQSVVGLAQASFSS